MSRHWVHVSADRKSFLLTLPSEAVQSDAALRAFVAGILGFVPVRSVTISSDRKAAVVRVKPGHSVRETASAVSDLISNAVAAPAHSNVQAIELMSWVDARDCSISFIKVPERARGWRKLLYLQLAGASLVLASLGVVLPGLPTTPFVLLASYCLVRSSRSLHERLLASRLFGGVLRDWYVHRGLRPHVRTRAMAVVAIVVALSLFVARPPLPVVIAIATLAACGLAVIWRLPSVRGASFEERPN